MLLIREFTPFSLWRFFAKSLTLTGKAQEANAKNGFSMLLFFFVLSFLLFSCFFLFVCLFCLQPWESVGQNYILGKHMNTTTTMHFRVDKVCSSMFPFITNMVIIDFVRARGPLCRKDKSPEVLRNLTAKCCVSGTVNPTPSILCYFSIEYIF